MHEAGEHEEVGRLTLLAEVPRLERRRRVTGRVRVSVTTEETPQHIIHERLVRQAEVERVAVEREVEAAPEPWREGDMLVIPVVEERVTITRRLVVVEELRIRLAETPEAGTETMTLRRQVARIDRLPADGVTSNHTGENLMNRTITAMFDSRAEADQAAQQLRGMGAQDVRVRAAEGSSASEARPDEDRGILAAIADLFVPDDDRHTYGEGIRRGGTLVTAEVAPERLDAAMDAMEAAGAVDLDTRAEEWRGAGWVPTSAATTPLSGGLATQAATGERGANLGSAGTGPADAPTGSASAQAATGAGMGSTTGTTTSAGAMARMDQDTGTAMPSGTGSEESIKLAEERLRVGKREAHAGRVRVRSYVVETPVEEQVTLREERVHVEQRPMDRAATASEAGLFQDRTIEAEESVEEAVVGKDVRVTGEVVVGKETTEHTETIRDTVRRTEVDVDQDSAANDPLRRPGRGAA
jgi:uncharacterized protein (TIGR02271 family)